MSYAARMHLMVRSSVYRWWPLAAWVLHASRIDLTHPGPAERGGAGQAGHPNRTAERMDQALISDAERGACPAGQPMG